jgi:hypothetical protein
VPEVEIHWEAPSTCPDAADVEARVRRLLGAVRASPKDRLIAEGTVAVVNGRYQLKLKVRQRERLVGASRVFDSDVCDSLAGAAAVSLALLAGGQLSDETGQSPSSGSAPSAPSSPATGEKSAPSKAPSAEVPADRASHAGSPSGHAPGERPWDIDFELPLIRVDAGVLPSWDFGLGLGAGIRLGRVRLMVSDILWLSQDGSMGGSAYGGQFARNTGELSVCYGGSLGRLDLGPCGIVRLEDVTASGTGPDVVAQSSHSDWFSAGVAARARWSVQPWMSVFLRPSLAFATSRPTFAISAVCPVYQIPIAAGAFDIGCEWIF